MVKDKKKEIDCKIYSDVNRQSDCNGLKIYDIT